MSTREINRQVEGLWALYRSLPEAVQAGFRQRMAKEGPQSTLVNLDKLGEDQVLEFTEESFQQVYQDITQGKEIDAQAFTVEAVAK